MSLPPRVPINVGLANALARLGIQGPILPGLEGAIQPVLVVADIHDSIASELVEARQAVYSNLLPPIGQWACGRLSCRAAGGLVVEQLQVAVQEFITPVPFKVQATIGSSSITPAAWGPGVARADIGGVPATSLWEAGHSLTDPQPVGQPFFQIGCWNLTAFAGGGNWYWGEAQTRVYVQAGEFLSIFPDPNFAATPFAVAMTWRELVDVQGTG